ncbi:hypothetical protein OF850_12510 [Roseococcus sp. MDT2-1-1]|uniref:LPXTG cell wall anchor domain-containing protein n=1 Tax=Sabulicella glaciei TaxID=2984948 RepID=A0ABT3NWD4_9PROT|nr:hypothetical protein [Roseococcus sp. MDT2-1-1]
MVRVCPEWEKPVRHIAVVPRSSQEGGTMNNIVYIVGAIVIVIAILSFLGLR